jgi:hypothetical protein
LDRTIPGIDPATTNGWNTHLQGLLQAYRLASEPQVLTPEPAAIERLDAYFNSIREWRLTESASSGEYAARWNEQAWRLCVVLHAGEHGADAHQHELSNETAQKAIAITDWFVKRQLGILGAGRDAAQQALRQRILTLAAQKPDGILAAHVYRSRITSDAAEAHRLLSQLEAEGQLRCETRSRTAGGWTTERYFLQTHA